MCNEHNDVKSAFPVCSIKRTLLNMFWWVKGTFAFTDRWLLFVSNILFSKVSSLQRGEQVFDTLQSLQVFPPAKHVGVIVICTLLFNCERRNLKQIRKISSGPLTPQSFCWLHSGIIHLGDVVLYKTSPAAHKVTLHHQSAITEHGKWVHPRHNQIIQICDALLSLPYWFITCGVYAN